jgi:hypothetical protein
MSDMLQLVVVSAARPVFKDSAYEKTTTRLKFIGHFWKSASIGAFVLLQV